MFLKWMFGLLSRCCNIERRAARRYEDGTPVHIETALQSFDGKLLDVSLSGVRLVTSALVENGASLLVRTVDADDTAQLLLTVKWVRSDAHGFTCGAVADLRYGFSVALLHKYVHRLTPHWTSAQAA